MSPHPLEALRYVARSWEMGDELPVGEVAAVLAELAADSPSTLLHACRRLIEYFPAAGPVWWLSARALAAADPVEGTWQAAGELSGDPTPRRFAEALPEGAVVGLVGPAGGLLRALRRRPDVAAAAKPGKAPVLVVKALAAGRSQVLLSSHAAELSANRAGRATFEGTGATGEGRGGGKAEVWAVLPRGTLLPEPLWEQLLARSATVRGISAVPAGNLTVCVSDAGKLAPGEALAHPTCPPVAELLGWKS